MRINFIADMFLEHILGGGELNNHELINLLREKENKVTTTLSHLAGDNWIKNNDNFIISNFTNLSESCKTLLLEKKYVIYEHDHKYIRSRNPGLYKDFIAPKEELVNIEFYKAATAVLCQSEFHKNVIHMNTGLDNLINLSGNLWSIESLEYMRNISNIDKSGKHCILDSHIEHKNTRDAIRYCAAKEYDYVLISDKDYYSFLKKLGSNKCFVFLPKTPETLSRVAVEARMMNVSVITNNRVGAAKEKWFKLKGSELIDKMIEKRTDITEIVLGRLNE
jgi:hypothetical protein